METNKGEDMRCKIGNMCFVIGGIYPENYGKIVKVIARKIKDNCDWTVVSSARLKSNDNYGAVQFVDAGTHVDVRDTHLLPILDQEGDDEMILIAGLPNKINEAA